MQTPPKPHGDPRHLDLSRVAQDLQIRKVQVENVVRLLDEENTIPFIARYRKELTGGLDEELLRVIRDRVRQLRKLADRKQTVLKSLELHGRLTPELRAAIIAAETPRRLEDLYLPYKRKDKPTRADKARERGLGPLADAVWYADPAAANLDELLAGLVNPEKELNTPDDVRAGVQDILAERVAEAADVREAVRRVLWDTGRIRTGKSEQLAEGQGLEYKDYFQFSEALRHIPPHRVLALNRGEKENALQVQLEWDVDAGLRVALDRLPLPPEGALPPLPEAPPPAGPPPGPSEAAPAAAAPLPAEAPVAEVPPLPVAESTAAPAAEQPTPSPPAPESAAAVPPAESLAAPAPYPGPGERPHRGHHHPPPVRRRELGTHPHAEFLKQVTADALTRLLVPSLEREIRRELTTRAEQHAVAVFARNLRSKLLAPPLRGRRVLAIDPGFRTGCKLVVLDEAGTPLQDATVFPHPPQNKRAEAKARLEELIRRHQATVIAIGNGTACRETEELVSELIAELEARRHGGQPEPAAQPAPEAPPPPTSEAALAATGEAAPAAPVAAAPPEPAPAPVEPAAHPPAAVAAHIPPALTDAALAATGETAPAATEAAAVAATAPSATPEPPPPPLPEAPADLAYVLVNEAGASVYSGGPVGREEFPRLDAALRAAISIGRRLQDPLSELVKIDPQHVGVGLYQHDVSPKQLRDSLDAVVESCVNAVGVDLNTAGVPLLRHVSGLNQLAAREIVEYRSAHGPFRDREQLKQLAGVGERRFVQAAAFVRVVGDNPLDRTWVHPESYPVAVQLLAELGYGPDVLADGERLAELREKLKTVVPDEAARRLQVGVPTLRDILDALAHPGRDPRDELPPPVFRKGVLKLEDLQPGMELKGTVLNVVDFGAFVDVGLKDSGLVHISQMANRYVRDPHDVVAVGDVVTVWVLNVDRDRHRVSLTMIRPGSERKPPERKPPPRREREPVAAGERGAAPRGPTPRGPRPGPRPAPGGERPPPRGGRRGLPPRGQRRPPAGGPPQTGARPAEPAAEQTAPAASRRSRRPAPKPKLSQAALAGKEALSTFGELAAFWEARHRPPEKANPPEEPPPPPAETPPAPPQS